MAQTRFPIRFAFLSLAFACSVAALSLLQHRVEDLPQPSGILQSRQEDNGFVAVTGVEGFGIQPRLSITELEQDADQWNIYLLGLQRFQRVDQSDKLSYFQLAGIHGRPFVSWDNVDSPFGDPNVGYCLHMSNLFLPWHRPYIALWEQVLYEHIIDAVNEFPAGKVRQRYASAALNWRQPYWDWAALPKNGQSSLPSSLTSTMVNVTGPNGTRSIMNPLYSYNFHPAGGDDFYYDVWKDWLWTYRYPMAKSLDTHSQNNLAAQAVDNKRSQYMNSVYNMFVNYNNFSEFGNQVWLNETGRNAFDSIESIHDDIHNTVGGTNGHMMYFEFAGFDPIFMLHHVMIDRCFALWQALHPDSYVEPMAAQNQSFMIAQGDMLDVNSPLQPFRKEDGSFWTSAQVRDVETFGYTYAELVGDFTTSSVRAAINKLYGPPNAAGMAAINRNPDTLQHGKRDELESTSDQQLQNSSRGTASGFSREYIANLVTPKCGVYGSYSVYIFIGQVDENPWTWPFSPNLAGTHSVFSTYAATDVTSPDFDSLTGAGVLVSGTVPLTEALLASFHSGKLSSMDPEEVESYLAYDLQWRIATHDGSRIPSDEVDGFRISVITAEVTRSSAEDEFPIWDNFTDLPRLAIARHDASFASSF